MKNQKKPHEEAERAFVGMNDEAETPDPLTFDSNFECGNLDMVLKPKPYEYDLVMRADTNTKGHHQWFYFSFNYDTSIENLKDRRIKFNILNFTKPHSMYFYGMRISVAKRSSFYAWTKEGENIQYVKSKAVRFKGAKNV